MANPDATIIHKESLMQEINTLFAPPTADSYGKKGLAGIPSARRSRKGTDGTFSDMESYLTTIDQITGITGCAQNNRTQTSGRDDPFWRKPRANCHEFCDSCGCVEGERLVCDRCPASFHLECLDPPLDSEEAPVGVWYCHRCSMILRDEEDHASTSSSHSTNATDTGSSRSGRTGRGGSRKTDQTPSLNLLAGAALGHQLHAQVMPVRRSTSISRAVTNERALTGRSSRSAAWGESAYVADTDESELRGLWNVIKYAQYLNPKEFDLPKDLMPGIKLPGSYKTANERKAKSIIELENGLIPRPVRRCFVCARTCLFAPLLPCDYCSSCFHLDCLDPPLPHFPPRSDRWMCPNHVEHVVDRYIVRSIRLTERMRIWAELAKVGKGLDSETAKSRSGMTTAAVRSESEGSPSSEDQPSRPGIAAPSNLCTESDLSRPETPPLETVAPYELSYGPDEEATILADLMRKVQRGRAQQSALLLSSHAAEESAAGFTNENFALDAVDTGRSLWRVANHPPSVNQVLRDYTRKMRIVVPEAVKWMYINRVKKIPNQSLSSELRLKKVEQNSRIVDDNDGKLFVRSLLQFYLNDSDRIESSTGPVMQPISDVSALDESPPVDLGNNAGTKSVETCHLENTGIKRPFDDLLRGIQDFEEHFKDIPPEKLSKIDWPLVTSLARQRISQLLAENEVKACQPHTEEDIIGLKSSLILSDERVPHTDQSPTGLRARAVLTPCGETTGPVVKMHYRQLTVGTSPDCHLCLSNYRVPELSHCRSVSAHHATLFYDEWTHHFELLNYSEFGTCVDGIRYGNDISPKTVYTPKTTNLVDRVRALVQDNSDIVNDTNSRKSSPNRLMMTGSHREICSGCLSLEASKSTFYDNHGVAISIPNAADHSFPSRFPGWEGPAILRHGSSIQFGCYRFVLGLVDYASLETPDVNTGRISSGDTQGNDRASSQLEQP